MLWHWLFESHLSGTKKNILIEAQRYLQPLTHVVARYEKRWRLLLRNRDIANLVDKIWTKFLRFHLQIEVGWLWLSNPLSKRDYLTSCEDWLIHFTLAKFQSPMTMTLWSRWKATHCSRVDIIHAVDIHLCIRVVSVY